MFVSSVCKSAFQKNALVAAAIALCCSLCGCQAFFQTIDEAPVTPPGPSVENSVPREKSMVSLPEYILEPPDILVIQSVKLIPHSPHRLETYDLISVRAEGAAAEPIFQAFSIDERGDVDLGSSYGKVRLIGQTMEEARSTIEAHLQQLGATPDIAVSLLHASDVEHLFGEYLVGRDGTVNVGTYGRVYVAGLTLQEAKQAIEQHLLQTVESAEILIKVNAYNSKVFYVITQGSGSEDSVRRLPITGGQTVLDAIAQVGGISQLSSKNKIWIARPSPSGEADQVLPIDWVGITRGASTTTNYQIMPSDRIYLARDEVIATNAYIAKVTAPFEQLFGFVGLGSRTLTGIARFGQRSNF